LILVVLMFGFLLLRPPSARMHRREDVQAVLVCPSPQFKSKLTEPVDQTQSSTFKILEQNGFNISYVDGTGSSGDYISDTFTIGGGSISTFEMGLATDSSIGIGIMGIGYNTSEANIGTGNGKIYPNLPIAMATAGLINANAYSLWLNDLRMSILEAEDQC
jgi:hypothetical protein